VITTIMLNYVAWYLLQWLLATPGLMQNPGSANPITPPTAGAAFPRLFGDSFNVRWSFLLSLAAVAFCWWLMRRSTLGFAFRAVGENPRAARVAGINVPRITVAVMAVSGALLGLAGVMQVLGTVTTGFTAGIDAGLGFDAITVALLGGSSPVGVLFAGLLFGAFQAGGSAMQAGQRIPIEIVSVIQSLIVLFIAAPPLVRAIFHLPQPSKVAAARLARAEANGRLSSVAAVETPATVVEPIVETPMPETQVAIETPVPDTGRLSSDVVAAVETPVTIVDEVNPITVAVIAEEEVVPNPPRARHLAQHVEIEEATSGEELTQ